MNIEKQDNVVGLVLVACFMVLKVCILIALFSVYHEHHAANPQATQLHKIGIKLIK